jgi:hypothetical protein
MKTARASLVIGVVSLILFPFPPGVWSAPPTISDFATCNAEAEDKTVAPSALPRDLVERPPAPERARPRASAPAPPAPPTASGAVREPTDDSGTLISGASNAQMEGMAAARADDPEYRAAYQSCMRRRGF